MYSGQNVVVHFAILLVPKHVSRENFNYCVLFHNVGLPYFDSTFYFIVKAKSMFI